MANRLAAVGALAGIAIALTAWSVSSSSQQYEQTIPAELTVSAAQVGSGNWVRYVVTVRNVGDLPFDGDVILENGDLGDSSAAPKGAALPPPRVPRSVPRFPAQAPDAAYQVHVHIPPRSGRTLAITAPDFYGAVSVAQSSDGAFVQRGVVERTRSTAVAVLTDSQPVAEQLQGLQLDDVVLRVTPLSVQTFPASALGLAPYSAVLVDQFDLQALSSSQREALRDFVGLGGGLLVAGGSSWRRTLPALPADLGPMRATGSGTASLAALAALASLPAARGNTTVIAARGDLAPGAWPVVTAADGTVLVADRTYGAGTVTLLAFDPAAEVAGTDLARAAWTQALGQALPHRAGNAPGAWTVPAVTVQEALSFPPLRTPALPSPWLVGSLLALYLVAVGPLNYVLLRRRFRSPDMLWITAPLIAVLFTGGFYWAGSAQLGGPRDDQLQVLRLGPHGTVAAVDYHRIVFLRRGDHEVSTPGPALIAPLTFAMSGGAMQGAAGCGSRCTLSLTGLPSGEEHVVPTARPRVVERGVVYGGVRILGAATVTRQPIAVETHLQSIGGTITGEIDNTGQRAVRGLVLYSSDGGVFRRTPLADALAPGERVLVSAEGTVFDGDADSASSPRGADPRERISRAAGVQLLREGSQGAWLVGFTDPVGSSVMVDGSTPPRAATAVITMPVTIERADGEVSRWAIARLAASSGQRLRVGFQDVYDLQLPGRLPPALKVGYANSGFSAVEVFDWSSGAWRSGGWSDDPNDTTRVLRPLGASEVLGAGGGALNLVRLRVSEPRLSWGLGLFVTGSG